MSQISMTITATNPEEFRKILLGLLGNVNVSVNHLTVNSNEPDKVVNDIAEAANKKAANGAAKTTTKPTAAKKEEPATQTTQPADPPKEETKPAATQEAKPATAAKKAKDEPPPVVEGAKSVELPDNIKNTNTMRELLIYLSEHGVDSADAMVATCQVLKKDVPILSKVPNVDERVRRAMEVLGLFPADAADSAQA